MGSSRVPDDQTSLSSLSDIEKAEQSKERDECIAEDLPPVNESKEDLSSTPLKREQGDNDIQLAASITDWDGPNDPDNPHNWSTLSKVYHSIIVGLFGFAVTFGTSVYTPAVPSIMAAFNISRTAALIPLTVYTLGLACGPIISAPLSETHGRRIVYMVSIPVFMLFTLGAGFSNNLAGVIVCRFLAGMTGSAPLAVGAGTNVDLFVPRKRAVATCCFLMAPFAGPSLGPVIGGFAAQDKGWKWTQWCMLFLSLAIFLVALPMKETYKPIILKRRAKKRGITAPPANGAHAVKASLVRTLVRPMHMLTTEPVVFFLSLYTAFAFAVLFSFFAAFPFVFSRPPYLFTTSQVGLTFLGIGLGVLLGGATGIIVDRYLYQAQHTKAVVEGRAHAHPEHRLYSAMVGSLGIPVGLFWFAWTAGNGVHWAVPVVAAVPFAWGNLCLFISAALYMIDVYGPLNGASAMAANGIFRYTLGAVFPLFTVQMYSALGTGWATSLLGFLSVLMLPIPWVLFRWGPAIRKRSAYPVYM